MRTLDTSTASACCRAGAGQEPHQPGAIPWPTDGLDREQLARYGKELIRQTLPFTVENRRLSWWHFYSTLLVIGLFGAAVAVPLWWPLRLGCSVLLGLSLVRMFVLYHDYMHGAILKGSRFDPDIAPGDATFADITFPRKSEAVRERCG